MAGIVSAKTYRRFVLLYQLGLVIGGVALGAFALMRALKAPILALLPMDILIGELATSASLMLLGVLGFYAGYASKKQRHFVAYGLTATAILGLTIFGVLRIRAELSTSMANKAFSRYWDDAPDGSILRIQELGECCGFEAYEDRLQEPCTEYVERVGCWEAIIEPTHTHFLRETLLPCMVVAASLSLATVLNIGMALVTRKESRDKRPSISQRQPFDAWHKAVFQ